MTPLQHVVQFYEDDAFLTESVASFIKMGLKVNDTLIIIATASHWNDLRMVLTSGELTHKNLMFFDAASLLSKIMVDDWPDQSRFMEVLGSRIQKACENGRVRVFGEMGAILWAAGKYQATIRLEELWNTLQTTQPFPLLHAYPHSTLTSKEDPQSLLAVCQAHTEVRHQKTGTSPSRGSYLIAVLASLPSSLCDSVPACCYALLE
jgi:hypothetical protein